MILTVRQSSALYGLGLYQMFHQTQAKICHM